MRKKLTRRWLDLLHLFGTAWIATFSTSSEVDSSFLSWFGFGRPGPSPWSWEVIWWYIIMILDMRDIVVLFTQNPRCTKNVKKLVSSLQSARDYTTLNDLHMSQRFLRIGKSCHDIITLPQTNAPWEQENHLQKCLGRGYVSSEICNLLLNILFDLFLCGINDLLYLPLLFKPSFVFGAFFSSGALPFQLMLGLLGILILTSVESQPQNVEELVSRNAKKKQAFRKDANAWFV